MNVFSLDRTLTELDHVRLTNLLMRDQHSAATAAQNQPIKHLLDSADIVPSQEVSPDVVTMQSRVVLRDLHTGQTNTLTLSYPHQADIGAGFMSVLSPAGWSLLGQRIGCTVSWPTPAGGERVAEILELEFQPESAGQYTI